MEHGNLDSDTDIITCCGLKVEDKYGGCYYLDPFQLEYGF